MAKLVAVGKTTVESYEIMTLEPLPNGKVVATLPDGRVLSVQPDGTHEFRPAGTAAAYEQASISDDRRFLVYNYIDASGALKFHKISLDENLPSFS
jgi:hypothetical protein